LIERLQVGRLRLTEYLLVGAHQEFQRVFLHHAVGILFDERFQAAHLGPGLRLLRRSHIGVIFGGVLDFFFLGRCRRRRRALLRRGLRCRSSGLRWRGSGLSDGGNCGNQQHRENNLLHSCGSLTLQGSWSKHLARFHPSTGPAPSTNPSLTLKMTDPENHATPAEMAQLNIIPVSGL
jgi:hypothetical protein